MEGESILKKTLVTMAAMVGACVLFVGTVSVALALVVSHAVHGGNEIDSAPATAAPALPASGGAANAKPSKQQT